MPARAAHTFLITLLIIFFVFLLLTIGGYVAPLVFALVFAGLTSPLYKKLRRFIHNKSIASFITVLLVCLIIILPSILVLFLLTGEAFHLFTAAQNGILDNYSFLNALGNLSAKFHVDLSNIIQAQLAPVLKNIGLTISQQIGNILSNAMGFALNFFIMVIALFYFLRDGKDFADFILSVSPLKTSDELDIYQTFKDTGKAIFYGAIAGSVAQGILGGVGFFFAGLSSPILWGTLIGFFGLIPFIGAYVVFIPATLYLFFTGDILTALIFFIYNGLVVGMIDNFLKPKVVGMKIDAHPLFVLVAILGGLRFFGITGLIYGPVILSVFIALLKVYLKAQKAGHASA